MSGLDVEAIRRQSDSLDRELDRTAEQLTVLQEDLVRARDARLRVITDVQQARHKVARLTACKHVAELQRGFKLACTSDAEALLATSRQQRQSRQTDKLNFLGVCCHFSKSQSSSSHLALVATKQADAVQLRARLLQNTLKTSSAEQALTNRKRFLDIGQLLLGFLDASSAGQRWELQLLEAESRKLDSSLQVAAQACPSDDGSSLSDQLDILQADVLEAQTWLAGSQLELDQLDQQKQLKASVLQQKVNALAQLQKGLAALDAGVPADSAQPQQPSMNTQQAARQPAPGRPGPFQQHRPPAGPPQCLPGAAGLNHRAPQQQTAVWTETVRTTTFVPMVAGQLQDHLGTRTVHTEQQTQHILAPQMSGAMPLPQGQSMPYPMISNPSTRPRMHQPPSTVIEELPDPEPADTSMEDAPPAKAPGAKARAKPRARTSGRGQSGRGKGKAGAAAACRGAAHKAGRGPKGASTTDIWGARRHA